LLFFRKNVNICRNNFFGINRTWIDTISWGGNPYLLAFSFCMFSGGLIILSSKCEYKRIFYVQAFAIASIPLIHAIAGVTFLYLMIPGIIFLFYYQSGNYKVFLSKFSFLFLLVLFLLFPFILKFKNENSTELLIMIKNWQNEMMGKRLSFNLINNILVTLDEIKYRIGDVLTILTAISFVILIGLKEYKKAMLLIVLIIFITLLVLNSAYWILPLSELLYPERVIYFMVIIWSLLTGYFLTTTKSKSLAITFFRKKVTLYFIFVFVFTTISIIEITKNTVHVSTDKQINCNENTRKGFQWIVDNTEKKSLIVASYGDNGMWVPAFTNKATLGTHLHFIHLVAHIPDTLNAMKVKRYYFITKRDISMKTDLFKKSQLFKKMFSNDEISIYK